MLLNLMYGAPGFILNLANYSIIIFIIYLFFINKKINFTFFLFLILISSSPFFANEFLFKFWKFPDQSKYLNYAKIYRDNIFCNFNCDYFESWTDVFHQVKYSSLIISLTPLPFIDTVNSLGFFSKFIVIITFLIIISNTNKKNHKVYLLFLISPTIFLYSSLNLKDAYLISCLLLYAFALIRNKLFFIIILFLIIFILREMYGYFLIVITLFYYFTLRLDAFVKLKKLNNFDVLKLFFVLFFLFFIMFFDILQNLLNNLLLHLEVKRIHLTEENNNYYNFAIEPFSIQFYKHALYSTLSGFFAPLSLDLDFRISHIIFIFENFLIIYLMFIQLKNLDNNYFFIKSFAILSYIFVFFSIGYVVDNNITTFRYKLPLIFFIMFLVNERKCQIDNSNKK